jgi:hypothetical protein
MPIEFHQIPLQKLLCEDDEYPFRSKEEEAKDIQAIRMYRSQKIGQKLDVVGSDIFLIEDAIKAKLAAYSQKDVTTDDKKIDKNVEKLPKLIPAKGRVLKQVLISAPLYSSLSPRNIKANSQTATPPC